MKKYSFGYQDFRKEMIFAPIRNRKDYIDLILDAVEIILLPQVSHDNMMEIITDKMNRVFFFSEGKYFSVHFPFIVEEDGKDGFHVIEKQYGEVNMKMVSLLRSMLERIWSNSGTIERTIDAIMPVGIENECTEDELNCCWGILVHLASVEDGYLRYDHDEEHANGKIHPIDHIDLFYDSSATFKLGINGKMTNVRFSDLLNTRIECEFVSK